MTDIDTIRIRFVEVTEADPASIDLPLPRLVLERRWYAAHVQTNHVDAWVCIRVDEWGHDAAHDWDWWRQQLAHHLPRFC